MKTIIAIALSSLITSGAFAAADKQVSPVVASDNVVDDSSRQAIVYALGVSSDTEKSSITKNVVKIPTPVAPVIVSAPVTLTPVIAKVATTPPVKTEIVAKNNKIAAVVTTVKKEVSLPVITKTETISKNGTQIKDTQIETKTNTETTKKVTTITPIVNTPAVTQPLVTNAAPCKCEKESHKKVFAHKKHTKKFTHTKKVSHMKGIDLMKNPYSISEEPYESKPVADSGYLYQSQVVSTLTNTKNNYRLTLSDLNGNPIPSDNFRNVRGSDQLVAYFVGSDLKNIYLVTRQLDNNSTQYSFNGNTDKPCQTLFVQYQLKTNNEPTLVSAYTNSQGEFSPVFDSTCKVPKASEKDNLSYSAENNIMGIFLNNVDNMSTKPVVYDIINNRNGKTYIPNNVESFVIGKDFRSFYVVNPISRKDVVFGNKFSQKLNAGSYYIVGQFLQNKDEESVISSVDVR